MLTLIVFFLGFFLLVCVAPILLMVIAMFAAAILEQTFTESQIYMGAVIGTTAYAILVTSIATIFFIL